MSITVRQSSLPSNAVQLSTGGSAPLTVLPVRVARTDSASASKRSVRNRAKETMKVVDYIAGDDRISVATQMAANIKTMDEKARETIIEKLGSNKIGVSADYFRSMVSVMLYSILHVY